MSSLDRSVSAQRLVDCVRRRVRRCEQVRERLKGLTPESPQHRHLRAQLSDMLADLDEIREIVTPFDPHRL